MIITSISYQAVKNLGNYESERLEATATVGEDESAFDVARQLRIFVHTQLKELVVEGDPDSPSLFDDPEYDPLFNPHGSKGEGF